MSVAADYFDGRISRRFSVILSVDVDSAVALLTGDIERRCPLDQLRVSERLAHLPRKVTFPDGAFLVVHDNTAFGAMLAATGHRDSTVVRLQQSWSGALLACVASVVLIVGGYLYGLPAAAKAVAWMLPDSTNMLIGREALALVDKHIMAPTKLSPQHQQAVVRRFTALLPPMEGAPQWKIVFRSSKIGPNAFALPAGEIIMTDQLIDMMDDDDAVMAVLSHELGHLHQRHMMRRLIQSAAVGAVATSLFGDVSSILVTLPTVLLDLRYSRDAETEADDYAIAMMKANGINLSHMADGFEKMDRRHDEASSYLSSHPLTAERIKRIRQAQSE